jgi:hypothetical protein
MTDADATPPRPRTIHHKGQSTNRDDHLLDLASWRLVHNDNRRAGGCSRFPLRSS